MAWMMFHDVVSKAGIRDSVLNLDSSPGCRYNVGPRTAATARGSEPHSSSIAET
jgi:hypothetical protein